MSSQAREPWKARRASAVEAPGTGANRKPGVEARAERAREAVSEEGWRNDRWLDPPDEPAEICRMLEELW